VLIPKEQPIVKSIHSSYVIPSKLIEFYMAKLASGCIHFKNDHSEGVIYISKKSVLSAYFQQSDETVTGDEAIEKITRIISENNYIINIYHIPEDVNHLYATLTGVKYHYQDLSTDSTDLDKIISIMLNEEHTGSIEVILNNSRDSGLLFFQQGRLIKGSYSFACKGKTEEEKVEELIEKSLELGGYFNVKKFSFGDFGKNASATDATEPKDSKESADSVFIDMLNEILNLTEKLFIDNGTDSLAFERSLKKKFIDKAEQYPFLDPFFNEFSYANGKLSIHSNPDKNEVAEGLLSSILEICDSQGMTDGIERELTLISDKYPDEWDSYGARLFK
jgi:hypothetical protein